MRRPLEGLGVDKREEREEIGGGRGGGARLNQEYE
jgi:hypothetical protein